jgi:hypothetical protein
MLCNTRSQLSSADRSDRDHSDRGKRRVSPAADILPQPSSHRTRRRGLRGQNKDSVSISHSFVHHTKDIACPGFSRVVVRSFLEGYRRLRQYRHSGKQDPQDVRYTAIPIPINNAPVQYSRSCRCAIRQRRSTGKPSDDM